MKKLIAILLGSLLLFGAAACRASQPGDNAGAQTNPEEKPNDEQTVGTAPEPEPTTETEPEPEPEPTPETEPEPDPMIGEMLAGGWTVAEDHALTDEAKAIFEKALEGTVGVDYEPIALLGTQVVAGLNYCYLAKATVVYPNAPATYALVYVYADLDGGAHVLNFAPVAIVPNGDGTTSLPAEPGMLMGGWAYDGDYAITDEIRAKLEKALDGLVGATYEPVANLGVQVVAGLNRCLLCKVTPVVPDPVSHYALVYVYEDLEGNASLTEVIDFELGLSEGEPAYEDEPIELPEVSDIDEIPDVLLGGWQVGWEHEMTDELRAIFTKALDGLVGVNYEPVACLGTQVVAGTNYCFLAKATVVYPDAQPTLVLVYIYEDLEGNAKILNFADMPVVPNEYSTAEPIPAEETLEGGWAYAEDPEITPEIQEKFGQALNSYGYLAVYTPVANLGTQVVAGLNRCILVRFTERIPDALPQYKLMYVWEQLDGAAEITDVFDFDISQYCTYGS